MIKSETKRQEDEWILRLKLFTSYLCSIYGYTQTDIKL